MGPKGEPTMYTDRRQGGHGEYMIDRGVTYGLMRGQGWGIALREATARKNLTPAAVSLGHRAGPNLWYPWPHGVALVFLEKPEWAKWAKRYPGVDDPGEAAVRRAWPEYFEGSVAAPPAPLRKGDRIRTVESLGKGLGPGVEMEVTRVTPSMIHTDSYRIPQWMYAEGKVVKVAASPGRVANRFLGTI